MRCGSLAAMAWRFGLAALVGAWTASSDIDVSITGVYTGMQFWIMLVVFQASLPRLGRTPSWMRTL